MITIAIVVVAAAAAPARADEPWAAGVSEADKAAARRLTTEGLKAVRDSRWPEAAAKFRQALKHWDHPKIHLNLVEPLVMLDKPLEAERHLRRALRYGVAGLGADKHRYALIQQKQLAGRIASLSVRCSQPGVRVLLDGELLFIGPGAKTVRLLPGRHVIVASKRGYFKATRSLVLLGGKRAAETVELVALTAGKTIYKRRFQTWVPWGVMGAGVALGLGALGFELAAMSKLDTYDQRVQAVCPQMCPASVVAPFEPIKQRGELYNATAIVGFSIAGVVAVAGVTMLVLNRPRAVGMERPGQTPAPRVQPLASRHGAGLRLNWEF